MSNFSINRPPDVVTVMWQRNPLRDNSPRMIVEANVIGSVDPCENLLRRGRRLSSAEECLLDNGFRVKYENRYGVFGITLYVRKN